MSVVAGDCAGFVFPLSVAAGVCEGATDASGLAMFSTVETVYSTDKGNTTASQSPAPTLTPSQTPAASVQPSQKPVVKKTTKNACTKVKAKKAKVTVKKGKKATLKFTVTAKNKKAKTTDKMKVTERIRRLSQYLRRNFLRVLLQLP